MTTPDRALVLTAGVGARLRPLSYIRAKAAVPIAGDALIRRILRWLAGSGIRDLVLNLHHRPETIARVVGDGADLGVRVRYSWEQPLLGSAGGPRRALPLLAANRFFIINGDTLTDVDLHAIAAAHDHAGARVTMALIENPAPDRFGGVRVDHDGRVTGFSRPGDSVRAFHFVGVQVVEADVFHVVPDGEPAESVNGIYRPLVASADRPVHGFICDATFRDVGTPADYLATCLAIARAEGSDDLAFPPSARIHPTARLTRTAVWDDVEVGPGAELTDCVVADGARIPGGASFTRQAIVPAGGRTPATGEHLAGELLVAPLSPARLVRPGDALAR